MSPALSRSDLEKEHFTQEDNIAESPAAPALYLVFQPIKRKPSPTPEWNIPLRKRNILLRDKNIPLRKRNILLRRKFFHEAPKPQQNQGFSGFPLPPEKS